VGQWWKGTSRLIDSSLSLTCDEAFETYDLDLIALRATLSDIDKRAPYESLSALMRELPIRYTGGAPDTPLTRLTRRRLLEWTSKFGLLGVLPHACASAVLAPRWAAPRLRFMGPAVIQQDTLTRSGAAWQRRTHHVTPPWPKDEMEVAVGSIVDPEFWPPNIQEPHALMRTSLLGSELERVDLAEAWGPFFPRAADGGRAEDYDYPTPLSARFWEEYAEPLGEFAIAAHFLTETIALAWDTSEPGARAAGIEKLNMALDLTNPCLHLEAGLSPSMSHGSLISALAYMAFRDLAEDGRMVKYCDVCGGLFTTRRHEARHCSVRCRNRGKGRRRIARRK